MGALFLHLKPDEYLKKLYKTKKLVEKTSFSLQAGSPLNKRAFCVAVILELNSKVRSCKMNIVCTFSSNL
ncbi:hypothetical protein D9C08_16565 [Bacillus subtilis subsp. subtilis]|nr:hypothetical protein D9C12_14485 [Bacillus subtilis subsp. subtilis]AYL01909.1 hypothetical protein D9C08_16565 [Bacillus subtilis subsp. subtilis]